MPPLLHGARAVSSSTAAPASITNCAPKTREGVWNPGLPRPGEDPPDRLRGGEHAGGVAVVGDASAGDGAGARRPAPRPPSRTGLVLRRAARAPRARARPAPARPARQAPSARQRPWRRPRRGSRRASASRSRNRLRCPRLPVVNWPVTTSAQLMAAASRRPSPKSKAWTRLPPGHGHQLSAAADQDLGTEQASGAGDRAAGDHLRPRDAEPQLARCPASGPWPWPAGSRWRRWSARRRA